jgi:hypothetical protein
MADLGTVSILVDVRGQPIVHKLATDLNNVAVAERKVSEATQKVIADLRRTRDIMANVKKATDDASVSFQRFSAKELQQAGQRMQGFERSLANTRRGMGQMGMATQQVGYQVGDFLVQIQSGTNPLVAFGQQATQLVGILPAFSKTLGMSVGSLIGISSVLGIAIPLATAIGAAFMRTSKDAEEAEKSVKKLSDVVSSLNSVQQATADGLRNGLVAAFGDSANAVTRLINKLRQAEFEAAIKPVRAGLDSITVGIDKVNIAADNIVAFEKLQSQGKVLSSVQQALLEDAKALVGENLSLAIAYKDVDTALKKIATSKTSEELIRNFSEALRIAESLGGPVADQLVAQLTELAREAGLLPEIINQAKSAAEDFNNTKMSDGLYEALSVAQRLALATREALFPKQVGRGSDPRQFEDDPYWEDKFFPDPLDYPKPKREPKGGAGKTDPLEQLRQQIKLENELLGVSEAQARVIRTLGKDRGKYSEEEINAITAEIEAYNQKQEAIERTKQIMDTVKSSMEDAFMSMVDGTKSAKDAFKDMAAMIIRELYRILVVQQLVNSIAGFISPSAAPTSSPRPQPRPPGLAVGGSLMAGGSYLVGEHGPELVIPRHSGTVVNANQTANAMGGSGTTVVNNNISVTGSDAAMVRTEIAKMIPQITNATKAAVIDAKQRGGQMAAAFR